MRRDRLGLLVILACAVVSALIALSVVERERGARLTELRGQGLALARLLARMPEELLGPPQTRHRPLELVMSTRRDGDLAYLAVTGADGTALAEVTAPGVVVPSAAAATGPHDWVGERETTHGETRYREFVAPLLPNGDLRGHVRIGYHADLPLTIPSLSAMAPLALPVFLLGGIFYWITRRESVRLRRAADDVREAVDGLALPRIELGPSAELAEFIDGFNQVMRAAQSRVRELEDAQAGILTSSKVLSYQKARIAGVLQSLPDGVVVLDEAGVVTFANRRIEPLIEVDHQTIVGRRPDEWCEHDGLRTFLCSFSGAAVRRNEGGSIEIAPSPRAAVDCVRVSAYPLFSPRDGSSIHGTLVVLHDVSSEVQARRAREEFIAHLAHELKSPLQVIGGYAEMLREQERPSLSLATQAGNVIYDEVERVNGLITGLLDVARIEKGSLALDRQRIRLRDLLADAFETMRRLNADGGIEFRLDLPDEMSTLAIDKNLMRVAINNLLGNAVKYNRPGGRVELMASETDEAVVIAVRDTGAGISAEDLPRIFDRFYRARTGPTSEVAGHGLGLALAKEIVDLHHGRIEVESTPGQGSEFRLVLDKSPVVLREAI
ncbi:MAG: PAS domain-containing protein [Ectothiorhodospiraceae bacterium]|nr:PAS domain-containing protein [Chromatiales bacterium]MCP5154961.1 PAS domain-containing protein [Ectothiorhodospiraceae bacterium]